MDVEIIDYGLLEEKGFVSYKISGLDFEQFEYLKNNLDEELAFNSDENFMILKMYYSKEIYPFHTEISKIKFEDFKARDEMEMNLFISSFLEDFNY